MPSELLRDVLRTEDVVSRSPRRWFLFPVSLLVHAVGAAACLIIPLAAEVTLPAPAPQFANRLWVVPAVPPGEVPRVSVSTRSAPSTSAAPREAPSKIEPEAPGVPAIPAPGAVDGVEGPLGVGNELPVAPVVTPLTPPPPIAQPFDRGPIKVGGAVRAPKRIVATAPTYPQAAMSARIEGQVILEALIDQQGRVDDVRVLKSVPLLDAGAVNAVRTWRYTPTLLNGVPVAVLMTVTVSFTLQR